MEGIQRWFEFSKDVYFILTDYGIPLYYNITNEIISFHPFCKIECLDKLKEIYKINADSNQILKFIEDLKQKIQYKNKTDFNTEKIEMNGLNQIKEKIISDNNEIPFIELGINKNALPVIRESKIILDAINACKIKGNLQEIFENIVQKIYGKEVEYRNVEIENGKEIIKKLCQIKLSSDFYFASCEYNLSNGYRIAKNKAIINSLNYLIGEKWVGKILTDNTSYFHNQFRNITAYKQIKK